MKLMIFSAKNRPSAVVYIERLSLSKNLEREEGESDEQYIKRTKPLFPRLDNESDSAYAERVKLHQHIDDDLMFDGIVESENTPSREYRAAWRIKEGKLTHCMDEARYLHMNHLRSLRKDKFKNLMVPFKLPEKLENLIFTENFKNTLQQLRDIPQVFDLSDAKNIDELKLKIPDILKENN